MLTKVLSKKLRADARIDKHSITSIVDLIKHEGRVVGAWGVDYKNGALVIYSAQQTILCTGGGSGLPTRATPAPPPVWLPRLTPVSNPNLRRAR